MSWDKKLDQIAKIADSFAVEETRRMMQTWKKLEKEQLLNLFEAEFRSLAKSYKTAQGYLNHPFRWLYFCILQRLKYWKMKIYLYFHPHQEYKR